MAGSALRTRHRHLSRSSSHRQALLRNMVTSLIQHESIRTTWPKAKEAQRLADKLITLAKRNTEASKRRAIQIFYTPHELVPKLFSELRQRYAQRPGGYTRVLRTEPRATDQAPSAILELVDGPKDMRFALTAQALARDIMLKRQPSERTKTDLAKVMRYRASGGKGVINADMHWKSLQASRNDASTSAPQLTNHEAHQDLQSMVNTFMDLEVSGAVEGPKAKALHQNALAEERARKRGTRPSDELAAMHRQASRRKAISGQDSVSVDDPEASFELPEDFDVERPLKLWSESDELKGGRAEQGVGKRRIRTVMRGVQNYIGSKNQHSKELQNARYRENV